MSAVFFGIYGERRSAGENVSAVLIQRSAQVKKEITGIAVKTRTTVPVKARPNAAVKMRI